MKKMNKKGFTLIELLAVIIILGVLMIIAIPSVTSYIQNSRKSAFTDSGLNYVKSGINLVNSGDKMRFYDTSTLYLIPAGHTEGKSCISLESGGQSPFSDTWAYAYVGVTYDGKGYTYYFIAEDGAGQGVPFLTQTDLQNLGADAVYSSSKKNSALETFYAGSDNEELTTLNDVLSGLTTPSDYTGVKTKITETNVTVGSTSVKALKIGEGADAPVYTKIVVLGAPACEFKQAVTSAGKTPTTTP